MNDFACFETNDGRRQIVRMDQIVHGFIADEGHMFVGVENTSGTMIAKLPDASHDGPFLQRISVRSPCDALKWLTGVED